VAAKKWLDGRLIAKISITTTQGEFVLPSPCFTRISNSTELLLLLAYHQAISWPPPWISHLFSEWPSWGCALFLQLD